MKPNEKRKTIKSIIETWKSLNPTFKKAPSEIRNAAHTLTGPIYFEELNSKNKKSKRNKKSKIRKNTSNKS